jgi:hypothetical protein
MTDFLLDYSIIKAGRKPIAVFRMRSMRASLNYRLGASLDERLGPTVYGGWRVHCRRCQWDDWGKGPTHAEAMDTAYAHAADCPARQP